MRPVNTSVQCQACDSEVTLKYYLSNVSGPPQWCSFCGENLDKTDSTVENEEDFPEVDWDEDDE